MDIDAIRTANFLKILRENYQDSPSVFEKKTGYSQNMVSQLKTGKKSVNDRLARRLESLMKLEPLSLDRQGQVVPLTRRPAGRWPFSVPYEVFESLDPKIQNDIDETIRLMVMGAQAQEIPVKPKKTRGRTGD